MPKKVTKENNVNATVISILTEVTRYLSDMTTNFTGCISDLNKNLQGLFTDTVEQILETKKFVGICMLLGIINLILSVCILLFK